MAATGDSMSYQNGAAKNAAGGRLHVPEAKEVRNRLRTLVTEYVADRELTPPLSLAELQDHSNEIIELSHLDANSRTIQP